MQIDVTVRFVQDPATANLLNQVLTKLDQLSKEVVQGMSTTNQGLAALQSDMAKLQAANQQILADVTKLLANQQPGLQPGQVIVNQADIDALDATVQSVTGADTSADATVNPKPPAAASKP
jgi:hypothetical protein